jgi:hypothetical protein
MALWISNVRVEREMVLWPLIFLRRTTTPVSKERTFSGTCGLQNVRFNMGPAISGSAAWIITLLFLIACSQAPDREAAPSDPAQGRSQAAEANLQVSPPEGYRAITESEYPESWRRVASLIATPDRAVGDFDGDSIPDEARIWVREDGEGWLLAVYLSSVPSETVRVFESTDGLLNRAVRTIPPGDHKTHRFYGIGPGPADTTAIVHLEHDAINLAWIESEGWTYVWDEGARSFERVAMY